MTKVAVFSGALSLLLVLGLAAAYLVGVPLWAVLVGGIVVTSAVLAVLARRGRRRSVQQKTET